jgi:predicted choloylglycine hydrolase
MELFKKVLEQIPNFKDISKMKPWFLPMPLFMYLARRQATKTLEKDILQYYPKQAQRIEGMIQGAGIDRSWTFFIQYIELSQTIGPSMFYVPACSSLGFLPKRTSSGEVIVAKNFDYPNAFSEYQSTCYTKPKDGYGTLGCSMAVVPGMLDGMNEHGLTVTYNLAFATEEPIYFVPLSIVLQEMLETCKNTEEAVSFLTNSKRAGNALLMLADPGGDVRAVEISHNHSATREPEGDQIINTNNYHTKEMQRYEIPPNAVFSDKAWSKEWYGIRVHESSERRFMRAQELLNKEMKAERKICFELHAVG